jgi:hypothetical protein
VRPPLTERIPQGALDEGTEAEAHPGRSLLRLSQQGVIDDQRGAHQCI